MVSTLTGSLTNWQPSWSTGPEEDTQSGVKKLQSQVNPNCLVHHHWKLLSPARRRAAVLHLIETRGVSERQACRAASQPLATQRLPPRPVAAPEDLLRQRLREISRKWPRWGFRRAGAV